MASWVQFIECMWLWCATQVCGTPPTTGMLVARVVNLLVVTGVEEAEADVEVRVGVLLSESWLELNWE